MITDAGLPRSEKKTKRKVKSFPGQGIAFSVGNFRKNEKVREFQKFPTTLLVNRLLEIWFSIYMLRYYFSNKLEKFKIFDLSMDENG